MRFPSPEDEGLSGVFVNTAGGVAGGDRFDIEIAATDAARLTLTTAAAEKVYRTPGAAAQLNIGLKVAAGAHLSWLPQETILFDRARMRRSIEVDLAADAGLILSEAVIFGRSGMNEAVESGRVLDHWRVRRCGRLMFAEALRLDGGIAAKLQAPACAKGGVGIATVLAIPGDEHLASSVRAQAFSGEVGISAWNGLAAARLVARTGVELRRDLLTVLTLLRAGRMPRLWLN